MAGRSPIAPALMGLWECRAQGSSPLGSHSSWFVFYIFIFRLFGKDAGAEILMTGRVAPALTGLWDKTGGCQGDLCHVFIIRVWSLHFSMDCELELIPVARLDVVIVLIESQGCEMNRLVKCSKRFFLGLS
jgi:hypothetical protein